MARKTTTTLDEIAALAERAQDLALEVSHAADKVSPMTTGQVAEHAAKFNQMAEACGHMNRMLLAIQSLADQRGQIEDRYKARASG